MIEKQTEPKIDERAPLVKSMSPDVSPTKDETESLVMNAAQHLVSSDSINFYPL